MSESRRRAWSWLAGGAALALANAWLISFDVNQLDEAWTLQVARRLLGGERLYDEVWFGTTPLSAYVLLAAVSLFGVEAIVLKALSALLAASCGLLVARIALQCGMRARSAAVLALLSVALAPAVPLSLYTPLAITFLLACESATLAVVLRRPEQRTPAALLAGALAGLSFASKQNVGALVLAALGTTLLLAEPSRAGVRRIGAAVLAFGAVAVATVTTMVASGGVRNALDALGLGKGEYLEHGVVPYHRTLVDRSRSLVNVQVWIDQLAGRDRDLFVTTPKALLPVVAAALLAGAWLAWAKRPYRVRRLEPRLVAVTAFALAGFGSAFPRFDIVHLAWVAPPLVAAAGVASLFLVCHPARGLRLAVAGLAAGWALFILLGPLSDWRSNPVRLELPHFSGVWTTERVRTEAHAAVQGLQQAVPDRTIFLVLTNASFYYLGAGLENPTRYDYPARTIVGDRELDELVHGVRTGTISTLCLPNRPAAPGELRAEELERALRAELRPGTETGVCRVWHAGR